MPKVSGIALDLAFALELEEEARILAPRTMYLQGALMAEKEPVHTGISCAYGLSSFTLFFPGINTWTALECRYLLQLTPF